MQTFEDDADAEDYADAAEYPVPVAGASLRVEVVGQRVREPRDMFDWERSEARADLLVFVRHMNDVAKRYPAAAAAWRRRRRRPRRIPGRHASGVPGTELRRPGNDGLRARARTVFLRFPGVAVQAAPLDVGRRTVRGGRDLRQVNNDKLFWFCDENPRPRGKYKCLCSFRYFSKIRMIPLQWASIVTQINLK